MPTAPDVSSLRSTCDRAALLPDAESQGRLRACWHRFGCPGPCASFDAYVVRLHQAGYAGAMLCSQSVPRFSLTVQQILADPDGLNSAVVSFADPDTAARALAVFEAHQKRLLAVRQRMIHVPPLAGWRCRSMRQLS